MKKIWVSKEEWATNPTITDCKSRIDVPPEQLSLHPADYVCLEIIEAEETPPPLVMKEEFSQKEDWLTSDLSLGVVIGIAATSAAFLMTHYAIKLLK